ncbi:hypothetical protein Indivirus_4_26 [Indivirus ILV1]|uniref:Uncharacterized protein n=1 Tax=Indivirus ILV1 TaxID=1977633 RepID=A0A1V0SDZ0_9VIRU|nr:hypothetical protein Indivirus_4_26 [Indivirus ILV1]
MSSFEEVNFEDLDDYPIIEEVDENRKKSNNEEQCIVISNNSLDQLANDAKWKNINENLKDWIEDSKKEKTDFQKKIEKAKEKAKELKQKYDYNKNINKIKLYEYCENDNDQDQKVNETMNDIMGSFVQTPNMLELFYKYGEKIKNKINSNPQEYSLKNIGEVSENLLLQLNETLEENPNLKDTYSQFNNKFKTKYEENPELFHLFNNQDVIKNFISGPMTIKPMTIKFDLDTHPLKIDTQQIPHLQSLFGQTIQFTIPETEVIQNPSIISVNLPSPIQIPPQQLIVEPNPNVNPTLFHLMPELYAINDKIKKK